MALRYKRKNPYSSPAQIRMRRRLFRYGKQIKISCAILVAFFIFWGIFSLVSKAGSFFMKAPGAVLSLVTNSGANLKDTNGRVNFLILGMRGRSDSEGGDLADTIIFLSADKQTGDTVMVSIPRDLWVEELPGGVKKVNEIYALGEQNKKGGGIIFSQAVVSEILGQPVHYTVRVDFSGFVKAIDTIGGIDVMVDHSFTDVQFPVEGKENDLCGHTEDEIAVLGDEAYACRFKTVHFEAGSQHMSGEKALDFVRSRHGDGVEGTDFARSKRQQKVIAGFKEKVLSGQTLLDIGKVGNLLKTFGDSVETNLDANQASMLKDLFVKVKGNSIRNITLDEGTAAKPGLLEHPLSGYSLWVLVPRGGDWSSIQEETKKTLFENVSSSE